MQKSVPETLSEWDRVLSDYFLKAGSDGDASPIRAFEVTPEILVEVCKTDKTELDIVLAKFKKILQLDTNLIVALKFGSVKNSNSEQPNFFIYLVLTLIVESTFDDENIVESDFRGKLSSWLELDYNFQTLNGIAKMWRLLESWLKVQSDKGLGFRTLILPETGAWKQIGHSKRLSFPTKRDFTFVKKAIKSKSIDLENPNGIIDSFYPFLNDSSMSYGLRTAFENFRLDFLHGKRRLADYQFWKLILRAAESTDNVMMAFVKLSLEISEFDEKVFHVSKNNIEGFGQYLQLESALEKVNAERTQIGTGIKRGILVFRQTGYVSWDAQNDIEDCFDKAHLAIISDRYNLKPKQLSLFESNGHWMVTAIPIDVAYIAEILESLGIESKTQNHIHKICLSGGVKTEGVWLGRKSFLPNIRVDELEIDVTPQVSTQQVSTQQFVKVIHGQILATKDLDGPFVFSPRNVDCIEIPSWTKVVRFSKDAIPHSSFKGVKHDLQRVFDCENSMVAPPIVNIVKCVFWEEVAQECKDLMEVLYADGASGWDEYQLVKLIIQFGLDVNPWEVIRILHDSNFIQQRLRDSWKGRVWTLTPPSILKVSSSGTVFAVCHGAFCKKQVDDFKIVVENLGGKCFRKQGMGFISPPIFGATGVDAETVAARLNWQFKDKIFCPSWKEMVLQESGGTGLFHQLAGSWDWSIGQFNVNRSSTEDIELLRLTHKDGRDHDLYHLRTKDTSKFFRSRTSAIAAAYMFKKVPLFLFQDNRLVRLTKDGGLPDVIALDLILKNLRTPGFVESCYSYPCTIKDALRINELLPKLVLIRKNNTLSSSFEVSLSSRRPSSRKRLKWVRGELVI